MESVHYHCPYHPEAYLAEDYRTGDLICPECVLERTWGEVTLVLRSRQKQNMDSSQVTDGLTV